MGRALRPGVCGRPREAAGMASAPIESSPTSPGWWFRSRETGRITIAQAPNPPLWIFLAATLGRWFVSDAGPWADLFWWVSTGALAWWAADEVIRGVNPWRRVIGRVGLLFFAMRLIGR